MTTGGYYVPVVTTGRFSDAPGSYYRSILFILQIYWDWIGNEVLITEGAMIISNSDG